MKKLFILSLVVLGVGCGSPKYVQWSIHDGKYYPISKESGRWFGSFSGVTKSGYATFIGLGKHDSTMSYGWRMVHTSKISGINSWENGDTVYVVRGHVLNNSLFVRVVENFLEETKKKGEWDFKKQDSIWKAHLKSTGKNQ